MAQTFFYDQQIRRFLLQFIRAFSNFQVEYGKDYSDKPNTYKIKAYKSDYDNKMSYSIWDSFRGMNIGTLGKTTMRGYTYDMMSQKTTYVFPLYDIKVIK